MYKFLRSFKENIMRGGGLQLSFPAGFRFHPTDEELVVHYLCRRCAGHPITLPIFAEIDLYKFDPWQLPAMSLYGEKEWYFFSPRDRKYPNGSRPNRAAGTGYWKATGIDKPVGMPDVLGIKKALVFYAGKPSRGVKTNWIMHEYRLANVDRSAGKRNDSRLDDWVLCRIYHKKGTIEKHRTTNVGNFEGELSSDINDDHMPNVNSNASNMDASCRWSNNYAKNLNMFFDPRTKLNIEHIPFKEIQRIQNGLNNTNIDFEQRGHNDDLGGLMGEPFGEPLCQDLFCHNKPF